MSFKYNVILMKFWILYWYLSIFCREGYWTELQILHGITKEWNGIPLGLQKSCWDYRVVPKKRHKVVWDSRGILKKAFWDYIAITEINSWVSWDSNGITDKMLGKLRDSIFNFSWDSKIICGIPKNRQKNGWWHL